jgi:hypothetical protein
LLPDVKNFDCQQVMEHKFRKKLFIFTLIKYGTKALSIMALSIMTLSLMTLRVMTLSIMTLSLMTLRIMTLHIITHKRTI